MTIATRFADEGCDWLVPTWPAPANVHAFVTTRNAPLTNAFDVGPARLDALSPSARETIVANRARVARFVPAAPVYLEQVHGRDVFVVDETNANAASRTPPVADAAVTRVANVPLAIRVADCLPVLFADRSGSVVAAAHAGWRGLAGGVLEATIAAMGVAPSDIVAWLGPAIGPRAFEVGADVHDAFVGDDRAAAAHFTPQREGKWLADLPALARRRLAAACVRDVAADSSCTHGDSARFFSWRRDRSSARMAAIVWRVAVR